MHLALVLLKLKIEYFWIFAELSESVYFCKNLSVNSVCTLRIFASFIIRIQSIAFIVFLEHSWNFSIFLKLINKLQKR